jgi:hypothetical protein
MEFGFNEAQEKLRKELHDFYLTELPEDYVPGGENFSKETQDFWNELVQKAVDKGYYVPGWPEEYGGSDLTLMEQGIVTEEIGYFGARWPDSIALSILSPALMLFGTEEQKKKYLPLIASGKTMCFQAFTEPDAGSDQANIQARGVEDGDYYIINGQKTFITGVFKPTHLYANVKTADVTPKHRGITMFMIPADTPGITIRPLPTTLGGVGAQNEIFFDNVRVPKDWMLGQLNRGFYHTMQAYEFERVSTGGAAGDKRDLEEFIQFCKETKRDGKPLIDNPQIRDTLAQIAIENQVHKLAGWEATWRFAERERLGPAPYNLVGFYGKWWGAKHAKMMLDIMGLYGQLRQGSKWVRFAGMLEQKWVTTRSLHAGGTFEIYKYALAARGLGIPRIPGRLMIEIGKAVKEAAAAR